MCISYQPPTSVKRLQQCDYCTPESHPVEYAIDGSEKWWQSPPLSRGMKYNEVNLTINFGQVSTFWRNFKYALYFYKITTNFKN